MNQAVPDRVQTFVGLFASSLDKRKCVVYPLLLSCLLLCRGAKSYAGLSRTIVTYEPNRASVSKFFSRQRLHSRNIYEDAMYAVMEQYLEHGKVVKPVIWILAIDGVSSKRGGFAKIDIAIKYRKKRKDTGPTTKAHTFIQGLLITHTGMRIPLPRRTLIIATLKVPPLVRIVVVKDCDVTTLIEYYELRWQIEIFFRELKSFMGLTDFTGGNFAAYERFVDMVLLAYLFLEWYRVKEHREMGRQGLERARQRSERRECGWHVPKLYFCPGDR